jgi:endoglucanase
MLPENNVQNIPGVVSRHGRLKVKGNTLIGELSQQKVRIKGVSLYWSVWGGEHFYQKTIVDQLVDFWSVSLVRAAITVEEEGGWISNPIEQMAMVDQVVQAAIARDIYVIVDFHSHHAHEYTPQALEFFEIVARKYGHYDHLIFEIYNEPLPGPWSVIKKYSQEVIKTIRQYSQNLVLSGSPTWSQDVEVAAADPLDDSNTAYALHFYAGTHGDEIRAKVIEALNLGVAIFAAEWGTVEATGDGEVCRAKSIEWLKFLDLYNISWANWSLVDIAEGSALLKPGAKNSLNISDINCLSKSGRFVFQHLQTT